MTAINAKWLLERDGELVATLRDGRRLLRTETPEGVAVVLPAAIDLTLAGAYEPTGDVLYLSADGLRSTAILAAPRAASSGDGRSASFYDAP